MSGTVVAALLAALVGICLLWRRAQRRRSGRAPDAANGRWAKSELFIEATYTVVSAGSQPTACCGGMCSGSACLQSSQQQSSGADSGDSCSPPSLHVTSPMPTPTHLVLVAVASIFGKNGSERSGAASEGSAGSGAATPPGATDDDPILVQKCSLHGLRDGIRCNASPGGASHAPQPDQQIVFLHAAGTPPHDPSVLSVLTKQ